MSELDLTTGQLAHTNPTGGWNGIGDEGGVGAAEGGIGPDGGSNESKQGDGEAGPASNACPSAQTQFGNVAVGDTNPSFMSGVGARSAKELLIFSGYAGPDPASDAAANADVVYVQAFDPGTGASKGAAKPLFWAKNLGLGNSTGYQLFLYSASIAPTGQIAIVYDARFATGVAYGESGLYVAFLDSSDDGGSAPSGLQLRNMVLLDPGAISNQPHVIWSNTSQAFVVSWQTNPFVRVAKFLVDGRAAGGNTDVVPTDDPSAGTYANDEQGSVGVSGSLFGVAYVSPTGDGVFGPFSRGLTLLDAVGNQVGRAIDVATVANGAWATVAGTSRGFVYLYDSSSPPSVAEVFVPTSSDAGAIGAVSDGGDAGAFAGFRFPGTEEALAARAISDDQGGPGGVGVALQYPNGVSFAYVDADGVGHQGPNLVIAHANEEGNSVSLTNFKGSFVVSLYSTTGQLTRVAASGCLR